MGTNGEYILVNGTSKTVGGPFTRYSPEDPDDDNKKSMLDLVIASKNLFRYIIKLEIDKNLNWTPYRTINRNKIRFTDHYALMVIMKNIPKKKNKPPKQKKSIIWNTNKAGGWDKYHEKTSNNTNLETA